MKDLRIDGCDYWGTYDGLPIYRCFKKKLPAYEDVVFAMGEELYLNGALVGYADNQGHISRWNPAAGRKKKSKPVEVETKNTMTFEYKGEPINSVDTDQVLADSWKRTVEDLVGERFSE